MMRSVTASISTLKAYKRKLIVTSDNHANLKALKTGDEMSGVLLDMLG